MSNLRGTKAPSLPFGTQEYNRNYQDQLLNILRLYFNEIDAFTQTASVPLSGTTANRPAINLSVGQVYFDTTLGSPIWWSGTQWISPIQIINRAISVSSVSGTGSIGTVTIVIV
jgi:hypothetical protein